MTVVIFRQGGNNTRIGNTFVWVEKAKYWCENHSFSFMFTPGINIFSHFFDELKDYFIPCPANEDIPYFFDSQDYSNMWGRIATTVTSKPKFQKGIIYPVIPKILGVINMSGVEWNSSLAQLFTQYQYVIVDEPFPFKTESSDDHKVICMKPKKNLAKTITSNQNIFACVHIRQGDYAKWAGGKYYKDNEFYNSLIEALIKHVEKSGTSKKIAYVHNGDFVLNERLTESPFLQAGMKFSDESHINDILLLCMSDNIIGPYSTFSNFSRTLNKRLGLHEPNVVLFDSESSIETILEKIFISN